jgi:hypothetical protein
MRSTSVLDGGVRRVNQFAVMGCSSGDAQHMLHDGARVMPSDDTTAAFCRALKACATGHSKRFRKTDRDYAEFVYHEIIPKFAMVFAVWRDANAPNGLGVLLVKDTSEEHNPREAQGATAFCERDAAHELLADLTTFDRDRQRVDRGAHELNLRACEPSTVWRRQLGGEG